MITSSMQIRPHHANIYVFELHIQEVTFIQQLKFILAKIFFKLKKTKRFLQKQQKKVEYDDIIFDMMHHLQNFCKLEKLKVKTT